MCNATEKALSKFDNDVAEAIKYLLEIAEYFPTVDVVGNDIKIILSDTLASRRILTLKNVDVIPKDKVGYRCSSISLTFSEDDNRFCFFCELENFFEEKSETLSITFDNAEVEVIVYNACISQDFFNDPWFFLMAVCSSIKRKADFSEDYCNNKEKELLPIIREISNLNSWFERPEEEYFSFDELKKLSIKYGFDKIETMLSKLETLSLNDSNFFKFKDKMIRTLCKQQYEPLWRDIYSKIAHSQEGYPSKVECLCNVELLTKIRNDIQKLMESKGYIGEYPDFVKNAAISGIRLARSHNKTYCIINENRTVHHIRCAESIENDEPLRIVFLCGTALLKKREEEPDIYGCMFDAKGRRLFTTTYHRIPSQDDEDSVADDLETSVTIATKKAECRRLTKDERKGLLDIKTSFANAFMALFIAGGLFAVSMALIMAIICSVFTAIILSFSAIPEMLKEIPWWLIIAIGWIGFGTPIAIMEISSHRK